MLDDKISILASGKGELTDATELDMRNRKRNRFHWFSDVCREEDRKPKAVFNANHSTLQQEDFLW